MNNKEKPRAIKKHFEKQRNTATNKEKSNTWKQTRNTTYHLQLATCHFPVPTYTLQFKT